MCSRWRGSIPLNGSSRSRIGGSWTSAAGDLHPLAHALRIRPDRPVGGGRRGRPSRSPVRGRGRRIRQALEPRGELDELAAGQERLDGLALRHEPDPAVDRRVAPGRPAVDQDPPGRGLRAAPTSRWRRVDLPAPFGPRRPVIPEPIAKLMSLTATTLPNQRETRSRTIGWRPSSRPAAARCRARSAAWRRAVTARSCRDPHEAAEGDEDGDERDQDRARRGTSRSGGRRRSSVLGEPGPEEQRVRAVEDRARAEEDEDDARGRRSPGRSRSRDRARAGRTGR